MGFNEDLQAISSQRSEIEKAKRAALRDFQVACRPAKEYALAAIPRLEEFFAKTVRPFVAQIKAAGVPDMEIRNCLFEIDQLLNKPDDLRMHLREPRVGRLGANQSNCLPSRAGYFSAECFTATFDPCSF